LILLGQGEEPLTAELAKKAREAAEKFKVKHYPDSAAVEAWEFSQDERSVLLRLAHESILSAVEKREIPLDPPSAHLAEPRGVFTSLYLRGELRGCVGYVLPKESVYRAVAETARAAAFEDTRFYPVTLPEARALEIELSILSPPQPISADTIGIGRHGLLITLGAHRGLLLPQVPLEHKWDRATFLEQTCRKAGLPLDAWKNGATIEGFTAEVFGDKATCEK
jgi:AmmeMemoRadiSam system protein A